MIEPFDDKQVRDGVISYRLSRPTVLRTRDRRRVSSIFTNINHTIVDPKDFDPARSWTSGAGSASSRRTPSPSPARSSTSGSRERHRLLHRKSTYARCGIIVNVTPLEPEWEGS